MSPRDMRATLRSLPVLTGVAPKDWVSYAVVPNRVEFWQGDPDRRHQRLLYTRSETGWSKSLLWP